MCINENTVKILTCLIIAYSISNKNQDKTQKLHKSYELICMSFSELGIPYSQSSVRVTHRLQSTNHLDDHQLPSVWSSRPCLALWGENDHEKGEGSAQTSTEEFVTDLKAVGELERWEQPEIEEDGSAH